MVTCVYLQLEGLIYPVCVTGEPSTVVTFPDFNMFP